MGNVNYMKPFGNASSKYMLILVFGLLGAGKTTILNQLKNEESMMDFPITSIFRTRQSPRILVLGLPGAGKTTILNQLGKIKAETFETGFTTETVRYPQVQFISWDGYDQRLQTDWKDVYDNTRGLIFVVDATDRDNMEKAKGQLKSHLDKLQGVPLLILANKADLPNAMKCVAVVSGLNLSGIQKRTCAYTNAITGEGLYEALDWLSSQLRNKNNRYN